MGLEPFWAFFKLVRLSDQVAQLEASWALQKDQLNKTNKPPQAV